MWWNSWATNKYQWILALLTSTCPGLLTPACGSVWALFEKNLPCLILLYHWCGQAACLCGFQCLLSWNRSSKYSLRASSVRLCHWVTSLYHRSFCNIMRQELKLLKFFNGDIKPRNWGTASPPDTVTQGIGTLVLGEIWPSLSPSYSAIGNSSRLGIFSLP